MDQITEKERARDEEYSQLGACERVIEDNRYSLRADRFPFLKKDGDILRCHGYINSMNEEVCNECVNCRIQYGHPFDPYWNIKDEDTKQYISEEVLKTNQKIFEMLNGIFIDVQNKKELLMIQTILEELDDIKKGRAVYLDEFITPSEFAKRMKSFSDNSDRGGCIETNHKRADGLMEEVLIQLGYHEGVEIFQDMKKWYA